MMLKTAVRVENERLAQQINREARKDPASPYANKFVGLANGKSSLSPTPGVKWH